MNPLSLKGYQNSQGLAKDTMKYLGNIIETGMSEKDIVIEAEKYMIDKGSEEFWYHGKGALVLIGKNTLLSISGRDYVPSDLKVEDIDLVTIDVGPVLANCWGDYARSLMVYGGHVFFEENFEENEETEIFSKGFTMEKRLHNMLVKLAEPQMTFEEIYIVMNREILKQGFTNLDFNGNLGHSIERDKEDRIYLETGNKIELSGREFFTFEPHIKDENSKLGFKWEDIYYFSGNRLERL